jgi:hypothetical protein
LLSQVDLPVRVPYGKSALNELKNLGAKFDLFRVSWVVYFGRRNQATKEPQEISLWMLLV